MSGISGTFGSGARFGRYEIVSLLGINLEEVYQARDTSLDRNIVLKVFSISGHSAAALEERKRNLQSEERVAKILDNHPNIAAVYEVGTWNGWLFIAMELLEGRILREYIERGPLSVAAVEKYAREIALVLAIAHERGVTHGHLKPANVFITIKDRVKVLGFGDPTRPPALFLPPGYTAPEQIRGEGWDQRADIFAFGAILYEMLSGVCPFQRNSALETASATLQSSPPPLTQQNPQVPPRLEFLARRCLAKDPIERFQSGRELALELGRPPAHG